MNEKLVQALGYVDGTYVAQAARRKKSGRRILIPAVAAVLALVMLFNVPSIPLVITAKAVSIASEPRKMDRPNIHSDKFDTWREQRSRREEQANAAKAPVFDFAEAASREVLAGVDSTNRIWSPICRTFARASVPSGRPFTMTMARKSVFWQTPSGWIRRSATSRRS